MRLLAIAILVAFIGSFFAAAAPAYATTCQNDGLWGNGHQYKCLDDGTYESCNGQTYDHIAICSNHCGVSPGCSGFSPNTVFSSCSLYGANYLQDYCNDNCMMRDGDCESSFGCTADIQCDEETPNTNFCNYKCNYRPLLVCMRDGQWGPDHEYLCNADNTYKRCSETGMNYDDPTNICRYYCGASRQCEGVAPGTDGCDANCQFSSGTCGNGQIEPGEECDIGIPCPGSCSGSDYYSSNGCNTDTCQCDYNREDCNSMECNYDNKRCEGVGTNRFDVVSDDYGCTENGCAPSGGTVSCAGGGMLCDQTTECDKEDCLNDLYTCTFNDGYRWAYSNSSLTEICNDGHDNDCNGKADCADPECAGKEGPGGAVCCNSDSNCNDQNPCTEDSCTDGKCAYTYDDGNSCGEPHSCPDSQCSGLEWVSYPEDGHDFCSSGECIQYSCQAISSLPDQRCMSCDVETFGLSVKTSSPQYAPGSTAVISGRLIDNTCRPIPNYYVALTIHDFLDSPRFVAQIKTNSTGEFSISISIPPEWPKGAYRVYAAFGGVTNSTDFMVIKADHVLVSQVYYDPLGRENEEEWIELYNPTSRIINVSGIKVHDNAGSWTIHEGLIQPGDYFTIARSSAGFFLLYGCYPHIGGLTLSLNNDGDIVNLTNGSKEIDMVAYNGYKEGWDLIANPGESIKRVPSFQDTDTPDDWVSDSVPSPHCSNAQSLGLGQPEGLKITESSGRVTLSWTPQDSASGYDIYTSATPDGFDFNLPYATVAGPVWTDDGSGLVKQKYYVVRSVDQDGNEDGNTYKLGKFEYALSGKGKNWISPPLIPEQKTVLDLKSDIGPSCIAVNTWNTEGWITTTSDANSFDQGRGYELIMNKDTSWVLTGALPDSTEPVILKKSQNGYGKNRVSLPLTTKLKTASDLMASIGSDCESVSRLNPSTQKTEGWLSFRGGFGTNFPIEPGFSYEVSVSGDVTWFPE